MVDIHCHLVPGVDDGAVSLEMSMAMIEEARAAGISAILTTPHIRGALGDEFAHQVHKRAFQTVLDARPDMELYLGGEVRVTSETRDIIGKPEFTAGEQSKYILLELEFDKVPAYFSQLLFDFRLQGITPIVAHPERNAGVIKQPEYALEFVRQGALLQVTNGSLLGEFGETIQDCALLLLESGVVSIMASDAHNLTSRRFIRWPETFEFVREFAKKADSVLPFNAEDLCTNNPLAICRGTGLSPIEPEEQAIAIIRKRFSKKGSGSMKRKRFFFM